jgi:hypothetical protein
MTSRCMTLPMALLCVVLATAPAGAGVPADPPRTVEDYVILAVDKVDLGDRSFVGDGHVGVNEGNGRLELERFVSLGDGTTVVADRVELANGSSLFDLFANALFTDPPTVIRGNVLPVSLPIAVLPPLPAFAPGTDAIQVPQEQTVALDAGAYGNVTVNRRGTLLLTGGTYELRNLRTGKLTKVFVLAPSVINIEGRMAVGHLAGFGAGAPNVSADDVQVNVGGSYVRFGPATHVAATLLAPHARVRMGRSFHGAGRFIGFQVIGDQTLNLRRGEVVPGIGVSSAERASAPRPAGPQFCTVTEADYGDAGAAANGAGGLVTDHPEVFPIMLGAPGVTSLTVTNQAGLVCFLPTSGISAAFCNELEGCSGDYTIGSCDAPPLLDFDPAGDGSSGGQGSGDLAGEVLAAKLNVAFSQLGVTPPGLGDLLLPSLLCTTKCPEGIHLDPSKMDQQAAAAGVADGINTLGDLLTIADQALSNPCAGRTCASTRQAAFAPPNPIARESITSALRAIAECFEGCADLIPCPDPS